MPGSTYRCHRSESRPCQAAQRGARMAPGGVEESLMVATCARCIGRVEAMPGRRASGSMRIASRQFRAAMVALATRGTACVPAPMSAMASPAACLRRRRNQGRTWPMAGVQTSAMPIPTPHTMDRADCAHAPKREATPKLAMPPGRPVLRGPRQRGVTLRSLPAEGLVRGRRT